MSDWREEEARNEADFRSLNEWTEQDNDSRLGASRAIDTYICECGDTSCTHPINLTRAEYEGVRSVPTRFAIALGHENPEIDRLLAENDRFAIVEKFHGRAAQIARQTDPRRKARI